MDYTRLLFSATCVYAKDWVSDKQRSKAPSSQVDQPNKLRQISLPSPSASILHTSHSALSALTSNPASVNALPWYMYTIPSHGTVPSHQTCGTHWQGAYVWRTAADGPDSVGVGPGIVGASVCRPAQEFPRRLISYQPRRPPPRHGGVFPRRAGRSTPTSVTRVGMPWSHPRYHIGGIHGIQIIHRPDKHAAHPLPGTEMPFFLVVAPSSLALRLRPRRCRCLRRQ